MKTALTNWNNYPRKEAVVEAPLFEADLLRVIDRGTSFITRGNGRCYGDASLYSNVVSSLKLDRILEFDIHTGIIRCQAGTLLSEVIDFSLQRGWFLPVTPGTKFITVGGAVASDVHGKNHHKDGSFSNHIISMRILTPQGAIISCSPDVNSEYFWFTCGGMGLTGIILDVSFKLKKVESGYIVNEQIKAANLDEILDLFDQYSAYTYSVAWIDCLGRGNSFGRSILMVGEHATAKDVLSHNLYPRPARNLSVPFNFPSFVLNGYSVKAFNAVYYAKNYKRNMRGLISYDKFFYPLDSILNWNRIYGSKGFVQYQFVIPRKNGKVGISTVLKRISEKGWGSFLAVLKLFGNQEGPISFNTEGYTLALDIPINSGLFKFLDELDNLVHEFGGRIYLTKDARMKPEMFYGSYPNANTFAGFLAKIDPDKKLVSYLAKRLELK
ncbi:MAG TPA: FAD-binding oxidoreductase [Cyclobacteriaceae bacterium]|nr:FAD-binding oxidoreductase [Cyclobacteriaceae bacterium]HNU40966.1 FAD-binding oxidoreductase [Cyclobacteriaceae bacterium]